MERREKTQWRIDKNVPLSLLFAIGVQSVCIVWWAATQTSRTENNTAAITSIQIAQRDNASSSLALIERLTRVETNVVLQSAALARIENLVRDHTNSTARK